MSFLSRVFPGFATAQQLGALEAAPVATSQTGIATPWGGSDAPLAEFVYEDVFGASGPVTRLQALRVPAVAAARSIILGTIAPAPLRLLNGATQLQPAPWMHRTTGLIGPTLRMMHTLDDHLFYGDALWLRENGADGFALDCRYVDRKFWRLDAWGRVQLRVGASDRWRDADEREVIYLPGPHEGLLALASDTIRGALDIENSWRQQAATPLPGMILQETEDNGMTPDEMREWVAEVAKQRRARDGAVMGIPATVTATFAAAGSTDLLTEGRNAVKLDVANYTNLNESMLGAALAKASLNYETQDGTRTEFLERLAYWTALIEDRLSLDDVVPHGQRVAFDMNPTPNPAATSTGPSRED